MAIFYSIWMCEEMLLKVLNEVEIKKYSSSKIDLILSANIQVSLAKSSNKMNKASENWEYF